MPIRNRFAEMLPEIMEWRQHLHRNPEILYEVHQTAAFVAEKLREFGVDEVVEGIGRTGVVGVIRGKGEGTRAIGLRADMDALPIHEETGLDYASEVPGKMHACGHDGHTSMLLGAAKYLAETRNFDGSVVLIFQPAEEGGAGADAMLRDGLMERFGIDEVYGMHNAPGVPIGSIVTRPGPLQASADEFEIVVTGLGGHAAEPHKAIDTTLVAAQIVVTLHTVVSRSVDPLHSVVLTVGTFQTDSGASNIIPQTARMRGTVRCLDPADREMMEARVRRVVEDTASAFGAKAELAWEYGYPVTVNDAEATEWAVEAARAVANEVADDVDPIMPSEDFSYMLNARPGAYLFIGNGDSAMCHHPKYNFNDEAIPYGCSFFAEIVERRLPAR
ncbi:M20 family metallopeptidase [Roseibacterium sp. SDUM158016]|uniref:M20 aminoacylase family protein n=1 Tax=Roseicyclus sediminis TaxID=2980997 RepID=UPI0021CE986F|nr:M20 aminoacylase family protein [Roseibacterium sp. SDUM158016]MCU4653670.1 M20 family metallopeptidase [Roseibacterium sp. SDUM158016]